MSNVAPVTHDVQAITGKAAGVGAFVTHLRQKGEDAAIVQTRQKTHRRYERGDIGLLELHSAGLRRAQGS